MIRRPTLTKDHKLLVSLSIVTIVIYILFIIMDHRFIVEAEQKQLSAHIEASMASHSALFDDALLNNLYARSGQESPHYLKARAIIDLALVQDPTLHSLYIIAIDEELSSAGKATFLVVPTRHLKDTTLWTPSTQPPEFVNSLKSAIRQVSPVITRDYRAEGTTLMSSFMPIVSSNGEIHMVIGADHSATSLDDARYAFWFNLLIATIILMLFLAQLIITLRSMKETADLKHGIEARETAFNKHMVQVVESECLVSLGTLASHMVHELDIPLEKTLNRLNSLADTTEDLCGKLILGHMSDVDMGNYLNRIKEGIPTVTKHLIDTRAMLSTFETLTDTKHHERRDWFNIHDTLTAVHATHQSDMGSKLVAFHVTCPPELMIHADVSAFMQVFDALISNSLTHGWTLQRQLHIRIYAHNTGDNQLTITYTDDGRGIPKEHLPHIFEPFYVADAPTAGIGLGLHVVKHLVENNLCGTISVISEPDVDTCFTLVLPENL